MGYTRYGTETDNIVQSGIGRYCLFYNVDMSCHIILIFELYCKCSVSCQFSDIGSLDQLSNEQKQSISDQKRPVSKQTRSFVRNVP